ncbi:unnamed protein product [Sphenostylis stenocarpa]|uniref:Receptor ligand binding region domain-containing protein n=1 Tax=Sphenostylis stenocarpa TaxID=92480 RepID=A0AA86SR77_9FABA|nr:unnamed protein product [Sphenostylis stenocarpa]
MSIFDNGTLLLNNILQSNFVGLSGQMKFEPDRSLVHPAYGVLNVVGTGLRRIGYWSNYSDAPPVKDFLETHPGAYTTSHTHNNASWLLFWERHMKRLSESIQVLSNFAPQLLFKSNNSAVLSRSLATLPIWQPTVQMLVDDSICKVLPIALKERNDCEELGITTLVSGNFEELDACETVSEESVSKILDVHMHIETYVPPTFDWVWDSNDGKALGDYRNKYSIEVQTAPISDGVLPGTIRQLVLEICRSEGIPFREVAPSWSEYEIWEEAFITNSLRLLQHVDSIQVPTEWKSAHHSKTWKDISWTKDDHNCYPGKDYGESSSGRIPNK